MRSLALAIGCGIGLAAVAGADVDSGKARGIVTVAGVPTALTHAVARLEEKPKGMQTVITMSNVALTRAEAGDTDTLARRSRKGELVAVEVWIDDGSGEAGPQVLFAKAGRVEDPSQGAWSAAEFNNQIAEGQLSSKEPLGGGVVWTYDADFRAVLPGDPSADLALGEASGSIELMGTTSRLTHAQAWLVNDEVGEGTGTRLLLSDRAVDAATAHDESALWTLAEQGAIVAVLILVDDETGAVESQSFFAKGLPMRLSTGIGSRWSKWEFTDDVMRGTVSSDGEQELLELKWDYEVYLATSIAR